MRLAEVDEEVQGAEARVLVNGQKVAEGRINNTNANVFSLDEAADVGVDEGTPVTEVYKEHENRFPGKIHEASIELK